MHLARFRNDGYPEIAVNAQFLEPIAIDREDVADIACERSDAAVVDELAGRAGQGIVVAFLVAAIHPECQHLRAPVGQQPRCECSVGIERERDVTHDLPEECLAALAGDALLDTTQ